MYGFAPFIYRQLLDLPTMKQYDRSRCFVDIDVGSQAEDDFTVSPLYTVTVCVSVGWESECGVGE